MPTPRRLATLFQFKLKHYRLLAAHFVRGLFPGRHHNTGKSPVYVISVPRLTERHHQLLNQFPEGERPIWSYTIGGDRDHLNMTAADITKLRLFNWKIDSKQRFWGRNLNTVRSRAA